MAAAVGKCRNGPRSVTSMAARGSHITVVVASESHELQTCAHVAGAVTTAIGGVRIVHSQVRRPP